MLKARGPTRAHYRTTRLPWLPTCLVPQAYLAPTCPAVRGPFIFPPKEHRLWGQAARVQIPTTHIFCKTGTYPPRPIGASKGGTHKAWRPVLPTCQRHNYPSKADVPISSDPLNVVSFLILPFRTYRASSVLSTGIPALNIPHSPVLQVSFPSFDPLSENGRSLEAGSTSGSGLISPWAQQTWTLGQHSLSHQILKPRDGFLAELQAALRRST